MNGPDPPQQRGVGNGMKGRWPMPPSVETSLGHAEHARHGGNREAGLVRAHEPEEPDDAAPVSRANQAAAFDKISRLTRNCLFSRRSRDNSSRSAALTPGIASSRRPSFLSACTIQLRIDCAVGSNSRARSSGSRPARTRSTIWRRNSGEYGTWVFGMMTPFAKAFGVSTNPGQSHTPCCHGPGPLRPPMPKPKSSRPSWLNPSI